MRVDPPEEASIVMNRHQLIVREIFAFLAINTVITAGVLAWMFSGPGDSMGLVLLMMWTPAISAFIALFLFRERLSTLGWSLGRLRILIESYMLPIVVAVVAYGLVWLSGLAEFSVDSVVNYRWAQMLGLEIPVHPLVGIAAKAFWGFVLFTVFIVGEEIGWSGYLVPRLLQVTSVPVASGVVGVYWTLWHAPAVFGGIYGQGAPLWTTMAGLSLVFVAVSLMRTVLVAKSGSLWTGTLLHLSHNTVVMGICYDLTSKTDLAKILVSESGLVTGLVYAVAAFAYWKLSVARAAIPPERSHGPDAFEEHPSSSHRG
jgi:membrane protease YdiL (CAAX protease family)